MQFIEPAQVVILGVYNHSVPIAASNLKGVAFHRVLGRDFGYIFVRPHFGRVVEIGKQNRPCALYIYRLLGYVFEFVFSLVGYGIHAVVVCRKNIVCNRNFGIAESYRVAEVGYLAALVSPRRLRHAHGGIFLYRHAVCARRQSYSGPFGVGNGYVHALFRFFLAVFCGKGHNVAAKLGYRKSRTAPLKLHLFARGVFHVYFHGHVFIALCRRYLGYVVPFAEFGGNACGKLGHYYNLGFPASAALIARRKRKHATNEQQNRNNSLHYSPSLRNS